MQKEFFHFCRISDERGGILLNSVIKSTKYCDLIKQAKYTNGNSVYTIEEIYVKEKGTTEIRFAYYKKDSDGNEKFVARPLDLEAEYLFPLLKEAIKEGILSKDSLTKL